MARRLEELEQIARSGGPSKAGRFDELQARQGLKRAVEALWNSDEVGCWHGGLFDPLRFPVQTLAIPATSVPDDLVWQPRTPVPGTRGLVVGMHKPRPNQFIPVLNVHPPADVVPFSART